VSFFNGEYDAAIADFTRSLEIKPDADVYRSRAAAYYVKGERTLADADLAEAARLDAEEKPEDAAKKNLFAIEKDKKAKSR
jgi:tetratricopeptide (TPR) repeat protein